MTAPTPERMRALANRIEAGLDSGASLKPDAIAALRAAADEVDRLRSALDESNTAYIRGGTGRTGRRVHLPEGGRAVISSLPCAEHGPEYADGCIICTNYEVDRLRAVIDNAPHEYDCQLSPWKRNWYGWETCTCWKAFSV